MKFTTLPVAALALGAMAATPSRVQYKPTLVDRDVATISSIISTIDGLAADLGSTVEAFSGDIGPVGAAASALLSGIADGVSTIKESDELVLTDALQLQPPVQKLTATANDVVDAVIAKKPDFVAADAGGIVYQQLKDQQTGAQQLTEAITSKVPESVRDIAATLAAGINEAFQRGVDAYSDQEGQTPGKGGSSSSAPQSSSAAPTKTSSASSGGRTSPTGTGSPSGHPSGSGGAKPPKPTGSSPPKPTGPSPPIYTGAASANKVGGLVAAMAVAVAVF
ncbi:hypothetical protein P152DRAFT_484664 [Eremomyces bilateralis CBS 781.70]|uniref:Cell wall mannoprotein 1 n=1 Tax=Eremomyces bilateralis CBS 781.70 TaxID=1392243 RepID=A0A6G1FUH5_9PEZI|nr:uncharacterized protein P152DRAFT_484664 [Eremomyces bilateralis CBS 781.70]KAF1809342.1 hypothetical protein P152DRAFT_484664 [Eremomyces bilateralis CBS 781.70]